VFDPKPEFEKYFNRKGYWFNKGQVIPMSVQQINAAKRYYTQDQFISRTTPLLYNRNRNITNYDKNFENAAVRFGFL